MKKLSAVLLALMLALTCLTATAEEPAVTVEAQGVSAAMTVNAELTVDKEIATPLIQAGGLPEEQLGLIDPLLDLLNALKIRVISADGGLQIDLDVGSQNALSLGVDPTDDALTIGCSLIPNYLLTLPQETLQELTQNIPMPGSGGAAGMDVAAMADIGTDVNKYLSEFMESFQTCVTPGESEPGVYEFDGLTFNVKTPMDVDEKALAEAVKKLASDILNDEKVAGMIKQTNPDFDPAEAMKSLEESLSEEHLPEVKVDVYSNIDIPEIIYTVSEATYKDAEEPAYIFTMMNRGGGNVQMVMEMKADGTVIGMNVSEAGVLLSFEQGGQYFAFSFSMGENNAMSLDVFAGVKERPLLTLKISMEQGGERTLSMDPEGKTLLSVADLQGEQGQEALSGLQQDLMMNLGQLMSIPEVANVMAAYSQMIQTQMQQQMQPKAPDPEEVKAAAASWKTMGDVLNVASGNMSYGTAGEDQKRYTAVFEFGGKYWSASADLPAEIFEQLMAIDIFDEEHYAKEKALVASLELTEVTDLETLAIPQEELDQWVGKTAGEMTDAGWEPNGYEETDQGLFFNMISGDFQYKVSFGDAVKTPEWGEEYDISDAVIVSVTFGGPSSSYNP